MTPSRREFVAMLLGAPVAAALACRGRQRWLDGELIDTGARRGHAALRDATGAVRIPDDRWRRARVVVVGGGVAGLAAAWWLDRHGERDVVVLELDDVAGGTARAGASAVTPYPWGAHYIVAPRAEQTELVTLLADMGMIEGIDAGGEPIVDETYRCREPEERVFYRGRWYEGLYLFAGASPQDRDELRRFDAAIDGWVAWRDGRGRRAFGLPVASCSDDAEATGLDRMSFAAWLDGQGLVSERLRWFCDYACRDDYGLRVDTTSAWAGLFYFAARRHTPGAESQTVVTWPDGNGRIVAHLRDRLGPRVETGVAVTAVERGPVESGGGVRVSALGPGGAFGVRADHVIVATPQMITRRIVREPDIAAAPAPDYGPWVVANLHLSSRPAERHGAQPAWDNVLRASPSLGYVTATHQRGRDHGPTVWTWYYPLTDPDAAATRRALAGAGHAEWAEVAVADLERAHPALRDHLERIDVAFWGHGMVRPHVGAMWSPARLAAGRSRGPIHLAHTDLSGIALFEEALDHGVRAARAVLGERAT
jgi:glycine/D-amino acid oxidase-like deaminating enzyme